MSDITPIESALMQNNLAGLTPDQRLSYYRSVCESLGLNSLTQPLAYITLSGKLTLYAKRDATDQLRKIHKVSINITAREVMGDVYVVTAKARDASGREDESTGAVPLVGLKGEALANAYLKAETKAKRRVTLSICGLGLLDETEVDSVLAQDLALAEPKPVEVKPKPAITAPIEVEDPAWAALDEQAWGEARSTSPGKPSTVTASGLVKAMRDQVARNNHPLPPPGPGFDEANLIGSNLPDTTPGDYIMPCGFNKNKPLKLLALQEIRSTITWAEGALKQKPSGMLSELVEKCRAYLAWLEMQAQDKDFKNQHGVQP